MDKNKNPFTFKKIINDLTHDDSGWSLKTNDGVTMLFVAEIQGTDFLKDTVNEFVARWNHKEIHPSRNFGIYEI